MMRPLLVAAGFALSASAAQAQGCFGLSDAFGSTTVTCSDGRSGILRTDPSGAVSGMIGAEVFSGTTAGVNPAGVPAGVPYLVTPPAPMQPAPAPELPTATPIPGLTDLQRQYLTERARKVAPSRPVAGRGSSRRPAGSDRPGGSRD